MREIPPACLDATRPPPRRLARATSRASSLKRTSTRSSPRPGGQLGDETELVRGSQGADGRSKKGDLSPCSGNRRAGRVRESRSRSRTNKFLKAAIDELQEAKANREASRRPGSSCSRAHAEPSEVGDFRRIGEDFYVTVDCADLEAGKPMLFFDSAYRIARAMVVATARKEAAGEVDFHKTQGQVDALAAWSDRIADMATKARTIQQQRPGDRAVCKGPQGRPGSAGGGGSRGDTAVRDGLIEDGDRGMLQCGLLSSYPRGRTDTTKREEMLRRASLLVANRRYHRHEVGGGCEGDCIAGAMVVATARRRPPESLRPDRMSRDSWRPT